MRSRFGRLAGLAVLSLGLIAATGQSGKGQKVIGIYVYDLSTMEYIDTTIHICYYDGDDWCEFDGPNTHGRFVVPDSAKTADLTISAPGYETLQTTISLESNRHRAGGQGYFFGLWPIAAAAR